MAHDVAVVQALPSPRQLLTARRHARRLVADMIAPLALELAEVGDDQTATRAVVRWRAHQMVAHIAVADLVLCTNEKQRDLLIGAGLAAGLLDGGAPLQSRVVVVPHGVDPVPPRPGRSLLRANGFAGGDDRVAVWGGGIWSWLDPLTAIRAVERLRPSRPDLKLAFVGLDHPNPVLRRAHGPLAAEAEAYVRDRGLEEVVAFRPRWLPREDFFAHLRDADVGLSLSGATLESRYASRTRVLDYLTAGLPVVCTRGDTMAELVDRHELGCVVDAADVGGVAAALDKLTEGEPRRVDDGAALEPLMWRNVARPLLEFCLSDEPGVRRTPRSSLALAARGYPALPVGRLPNRGRRRAGGGRREAGRQTGEARLGVPRPADRTRARYYSAALLDRATALKPVARAREAIAAARAPDDDAPHDGLPVPPARLRVLVSGPSREPFLDETIAGVRAIRDVLGERLRGTVLDFGCGCGRTARHWRQLELDLHGCDYNPELVAWCRDNLPFMETAVNAPEPPSPYPANAFDLVYSVSVLTHLTESSQLRWLEDWRRILRPEGLLLFTTHGDSHRHKLGRRHGTQYDRGELVVCRPSIEGLNQCVAFHPPAYVRETLLERWELLSFRAASDYLQDIWLVAPRT